MEREKGVGAGAGSGGVRWKLSTGCAWILRQAAVIDSRPVAHVEVSLPKGLAGAKGNGDKHLESLAFSPVHRGMVHAGFVWVVFGARCVASFSRRMS